MLKDRLRGTEGRENEDMYARRKVVGAKGDRQKTWRFYTYTKKNELGHYCLGLNRRFILNLVAVVLKNSHFAVNKL